MRPSHATTGGPAPEELTGKWRVVHVWVRSRGAAWPPVLAIGTACPSALEAAAPDFCGPRELARLETFTSPRGRHAFLRGRLAAKIAVRAILGRLDPSTRFDALRVEVENDRHGRPTVPGAPEIGVSLSHCQGAAAAVAFPRNLPLGLDLERVRPQNALALADRIAPCELALARRATPPEAHAALPLTLAWCLKEALGKLLGCGLAATPETLAIASLDPAPGAIAAGYAHAAGFQGLAVVWASTVLALAAPGKVTLEPDSLALAWCGKPPAPPWFPVGPPAEGFSWKSEKSGSYLKSEG